MKNRIRFFGWILAVGAMLALLLPLALSAQVFYNNGANIWIGSGSTAVLYIDGSSEVNNGGTFDNSGSIIVKGNFINNAGNTAFINSSPGMVRLDGAAQQIAGGSVTKFNDLTLGGTAIKSLGINAQVEGVLDLQDRELATGAFTMSVLNTATNAVQRSTGFVSSAAAGSLSRNTASMGAYLFPVGSSSGTTRYRPVELRPVSALANTFSIRFANNDPDSDGFLRSNNDGSFCRLNDQYYHHIGRNSGSSAADITAYFDNVADDNFAEIAHWQNLPRWEDTGLPTLTANPSPVLSSLSIASWNDFSYTPFSLGVAAALVSLSTTGDTICAGATFLANASGGYSQYQFLVNATVVQTGPSASFSSASLSSGDTVRVTVTDSNGCPATSYRVITVSPLPTVNLGPDTTICTGQSLTLDAGNPGATFSWSTGATTQTISAASGGTYSVTVTNASGCIGDDAMVLSLSPQPTVNLGPDTTICTGQSLTLDAGNSGSTFIWSTGATTQTISASAGGTYSVTVTNPFGCAGSDAINMTLIPGPNALFSSDTVNKPTVQFSDLSTGTPSTWFWDFGDGNTSTQQHPSHTYAAAGSYTVSLIVSNACGSDTVIGTVTFVIVGVDEALSSNITIFPNPNSGRFEVAFGNMGMEGVEIEVWNALGQKISCSQLGFAGSHHRVPMDLAFVAKGSYAVVVKSSEGVFRRVVLIQ